MALSLLFCAHSDATRPRQPKQLPNDIELSMMPSESRVSPMPLPAAHPSRASSSRSSSTTSIICTNTTSAYSVVYYPTSNSSTSTHSRTTLSASADPISALSTTSAPTVVFKPIPKVKSMDMGWKAIDLKVRNVFLPPTPVLRPLVLPMLGLTTTIPELRLDLIAPTPVLLPKTPVLRPWGDEDTLEEIPYLDLQV